ncbi:MAG: M56 family metallopeptidase [Bacteroidota bacterium]
MIFILTTTLLSASLWAIYHFLLRSSTVLWARKYFLYFLLASMTFLGIYTLSLTVLPVPATHTYSVWDQIPKEDLIEFCRCANPTYKHKILYKSQVVFSLYHTYRWWVHLILWTGFWICLLQCLYACYKLFKLTKQHGGDLLAFRGKVFHLIQKEEKDHVGVFSWKKSYLLWPGWMKSLPQEQLHAILAHEGSHIDQKNTHELILLSLLKSLSWFNPIFYLIKKELCLLSEYQADQEGIKAFGNPVGYAKFILSLQKEQVNAFVQSLGKHPINQRICFILHKAEKPQLHTRRIWMAYLFGLSMLLSSGFLSRHYTQEYQKFAHLSQQIDNQIQGVAACKGCAVDIQTFNTHFKSSQGVFPGQSSLSMEKED